MIARNFIYTYQGIDLDQFISSNNDMFPVATTYPTFLDHNLQSPSRTIKYFADDPHSNIRAFYYHLFKFSYLDHQGKQILKASLNRFNQTIFDEDFEIRFSTQTEQERQLFNSIQFKRFLAEFLIHLDSQQWPDLEKAINKYPIMDIVLIHIFRSLLCALGIDEQYHNKIQTETVFGALSGYLQLNLTKYGNCWKFDDSDLFCLDQGNELYIIFTIQISTYHLSNSHSYRQCQSILTPDYNSQSSALKDINNFGYTFGKNQISQVLQKSKNLFLNNNSVNTIQSCYENSSFFKKNNMSNNSDQIKNDILNLELSAEKLFSNSVLKGKNIAQNRGTYLPEFSILSKTSEFNQPRSTTLSSNSEVSKQLRTSNQDNFKQHQVSTTQPTLLSKKSYLDYNNNNIKASEQYILPQTYKVNLQIDQKNQIKQQDTLDFLLYSPLDIKPIQQHKNSKVKPPILSKFASNKSTIIQDYYQDFTNSFLLPIIRQPFQSNLRGIKNRVKGLRRENIKQVF